MQKYRF